MKLLVLTPEPVDAGMLRSTLGEEVEGAEALGIPLSHALIGR